MQIKVSEEQGPIGQYCARVPWDKQTIYKIESQNTPSCVQRVYFG